MRGLILSNAKQVAGGSVACASTALFGVALGSRYSRHPSLKLPSTPGVSNHTYSLPPTVSRECLTSIIRFLRVDSLGWTTIPVRVRQGCCCFGGWFSRSGLKRQAASLVVLATHFLAGSSAGVNQILAISHKLGIEIYVVARAGPHPLQVRVLNCRSWFCVSRRPTDAGFLVSRRRSRRLCKQSRRPLKRTHRWPSGWGQPCGCCLRSKSERSNPRALPWPMPSAPTRPQRSLACWC